MAHPTKRFRLSSQHSLGRQVMFLFGVAMSIMWALSALGATYFVYLAEGSAWPGRQGEAARNAAGTIAAVIQ